MKKLMISITHYYRFNLLLIIISIFVLFSSCKEQPANENYGDHIYQYSVIDALLAGVYDGDLTFKELETKGDFGIGTFNQLDGELLINDGVVYKIRYDGRVQIVPDADKTSLAFVKTFNADTVFTIKASEKLNYEQLKELLNNQLNENDFYALRLSGSFSNLKTRAPAPATKPYPPLAEYLKDNQHVFELGNSEGIAIGFYMPPYVKGVNVPGFHFHFLSSDHQSGGHVLDFSVSDLKVELDHAQGLIIESIDSKDFRNADLDANRQNEVEQVESGKVDTE